MNYLQILAIILCRFIRGNLVVKRQPLLPRVLAVTDGAAVARKPFKPPCYNGCSNQNEQLARRLWARKRFVPWGSSRPALVPITNCFNISGTAKKDVVEESVSLPPGVEPLVLWQPEIDESEDIHITSVPIVVDPLLVRFLRPHQRYSFCQPSSKLLPIREFGSWLLIWWVFKTVNISLQTILYCSTQ